MGAVLRWVLPLLLAVGATSACALEETVVGEPPPTEIAVDPLEFLGDLPCSEDAGAARAYVAAATDVTAGFVLAAAPPAPCSTRVAFRYIVIGHAYSAEVDVYDRPVAELFPAGGASSGSRVMLDAEGAVVAPRWRTRCGASTSGPAVAVDDTSVVVSGCDALAADGGATTALVVDPSGALGGLACDDDGGEVDRVRVVPVAPDGVELPTVTVACGADPVTFREGIEPGTLYEFRLEGLAEGEDEPRWGSSCVVIAAEGVERRASCDPLTDAAAILVDPSALEGPGFACGVDYDAFSVALDGPVTVSLPRTPCGKAARLAPLPAGHYEGTLSTFEDEQIERTARCEVDVAPAETARLDCTFD